MGASRLRVVLAENGLTETGLTLRSLCAETGKVLELVRVGEGEDLVQVLQAHRPDIALLKWAVLQPDAAGRLRVLQENSPSIPLILLAEPADNVSAETCLALGVADYLVEGYLDERTMSRALGAAIGRNLAGRGEAVAWEGATFPVEQADLGAGWARKGADEWVFTLVLGDTGRMQAKCGSEAASQAIQDVAEVLRRSVRSTDRVERVSESALVVRVRNVDEKGCAMVRKRIEAMLEQHGVGVC